MVEVSNTENDAALRNQAEQAKKMLDEGMGAKTEDLNTAELEAAQEEDPKIKQFTVSNPIKMGGHIVYTIKGVDRDGPFEECRRFKEFFALREVLITRWPGVYIPPIPEKKVVVSNSFNYVNLIRVTTIKNSSRREEVFWKDS
jgi:hypothetical protein